MKEDVSELFKKLDLELDHLQNLAKSGGAIGVQSQHTQRLSCGCNGNSLAEKVDGFMPYGGKTKNDFLASALVIRFLSMTQNPPSTKDHFSKIGDDSAMILVSVPNSDQVKLFSLYAVGSIDYSLRPHTKNQIEARSPYNEKGELAPFKVVSQTFSKSDLLHPVDGNPFLNVDLNKIKESVHPDDKTQAFENPYDAIRSFYSQVKESSSAEGAKIETVHTSYQREQGDLVQSAQLISPPNAAVNLEVLTEGYETGIGIAPIFRFSKSPSTRNLAASSHSSPNSSIPAGQEILRKN